LMCMFAYFFDHVNYSYLPLLCLWNCLVVA